jgi:pteridine reductase
MKLEGTTALVTGAARRIGRSVAIALARAGADVAVHYHSSANQAALVVDEIRAIGRRAEAIRADLADPAEIDALFDGLSRRMGPLGLLVNNAAVYERTPIEKLSAEQWDRILAVNARAPALCISRAAAMMERGAIVNIADVSADSPRAKFPAYSASKAALLALTRSAAKALAPRITVNAVCPGAILWAEGASEEEKRKVLAMVPMARQGTPEDVAAAVVFLAGQDYVTGQALRVDGGWKTL